MESIHPLEDSFGEIIGNGMFLKGMNYEIKKYVLFHYSCMKNHAVAIAT